MTPVMVDSSVLLDVLTRDLAWYDRSASALERLADRAILVINPIIYSEVSVGFDRIEDLEDALPSAMFRREPIPWEAAFLAGKCFVSYRRKGGLRTAPLPDFFIGAHAAVARYSLLTRDPTRIRTYFPTVDILAPS